MWPGQRYVEADFLAACGFLVRIERYKTGREGKGSLAYDGRFDLLFAKAGARPVQLVYALERADANTIDDPAIDLSLLHLDRHAHEQYARLDGFGVVRRAIGAGL